MDLHKGILKFNEVEIMPLMTQDAFEALFPKGFFRIIKSAGIPDTVLLVNIGSIKCDDMLARVTVYFYKSIIRMIEIICIDDRFRNPVNDWSDEKYELKRDFHNKWLFQRLGVPTTVNEWKTTYSFDWGTISSESNPRDSTLEIVVVYGELR